MRARFVPILALALSGASCFQVEPLPDCADQGGEGALYVRHHVCMPLAGDPLTMDIAPRKLLRADFDGDGVDNDFAVLLDFGFIAIYLTRDGKSEPVAGLQIEGRVEAITAARYFSGGEFGDDLLGVVAGDPMAGLPGTVFGFHNGGDLFASGVQEQFSAFTLLPPGNCPKPNSIAMMDVVGQAQAGAIAVGCESGPAPMDMPMAEPLDGILVFREDKAIDLQTRLGLVIPKLVKVHAATLGQLDGRELEDIVVAYEPPMSDHEALAVYPLFAEELTKGKQREGTEIPLAHGAISRVLLGDLDGDNDVDLVAVHPGGGGLSVIRQKRSEPLAFEDPQFFDLEQPILDAVIGDFTGDGGPDIAVAHEVDGSGGSQMTLLVRVPDLDSGQVDYAFAPAASISGEILDLEALDHDGDGRTDIAAVIKVGSEGRLHFWLNRSPAGA